MLRTLGNRVRVRGGGGTDAKGTVKLCVLQGAGVKVILVGDTFISKSGVTSSTFKTLPDTPFSSAEVTLPEGKFSALAANGSLCKQKLTMPTELVAQNGQEIKETTKVSVTGCPKAKKAKKHKKHSKKSARKSKGAGR